MKKSIKLNVPERLELSTIIAGFGYNRALLQQAEDTMKMIAFTPKELDVFGIHTDIVAGRTSWKENQDVEFDIPEDVTVKIMAYFDGLFKQEKMTLHMKPLYDKFYS